jgi:signal transduction histidine kinase
MPKTCNHLVSRLPWLLVLLGPLNASSQTEKTLPALTNAVQVRQLSPEIAGKNLPLQLHGVVTYYDPFAYNLFVQDATAGIFVLMETNLAGTLAAGQEISLAGVSAKGDFAPIVRSPEIRVMGPGQMPVPLRINFDQLATGIDDSQWIEVSGLVRSATRFNDPFHDRYYLSLLMEGRRLMVSVRGLKEGEAAALVNTRVRVRGVCYSRFNMKRQLRMPWVAVSSPADLVIEEPSSGEPEEVSIASLSQFNSQADFGHRLKVSGVVTLQKSDGSFFMQSDGTGLWVMTDQDIKLSPGDRVSVAGYTSPGQYTPYLEDAVVQIPGKADLPAPVTVTLEASLNSPEDFEGLLVQVNASLINIVAGPVQQTLVLQASNTIFTAHVESPQADARFRALKLGSEITLTGVFMAQPPNKWMPQQIRSREIPARERIVPDIDYPRPESVEIFLRSSANIAVRREPSWWTLARLLWTIGILSLILLAGLAWVVVLDRRVRRQTRIIQANVKHEGVLEERDRIAREFHDTLEQELAAITIQLDAVEAQFTGSPAAARRYLGLARNMTRRSLSEARRSVWDLRSHLLENSDLATALTELTAPLSAASGVEIAVQSSGVPRKLPALTEHHFLRVTQEAIANALKHAGAKKINVTLDYKSARVQLRLCDDGIGFDPATAGQAGAGHFGLLDMRERAEKIGAHFLLHSRPGNGTEIVITVADASHAPNLAPPGHE